MKDEVRSVNRACLQAAMKLCDCEDKWQKCMLREFGMVEKDKALIQGLDRETVRRKSENPTVLFKVRQDRMRNAVQGLARGADYYNARHMVSKESSMAVSVYAGALLKCLQDNVNECCMRFGISPEMGDELLNHDTDEVIDAMLANHVTFEPSRSFKAMFSANNNLERTRFMLQDMTNFLSSNKVLVSTF